jgi:hypothetical protein
MQNSTLVVCLECQSLFSEGPAHCPGCGEQPLAGGFKDTVKCENPKCRLTLPAGTSRCGGCGNRQPELIVLEPASHRDPPDRGEGC